MRTTRLAFVSVAAMALSAGAAYSITPDGGFQRAAHADNPLDPLALLEPDADWFRPRAETADTGAGTSPTAAPTVDVELVQTAQPLAFAEPKAPEPLRSAPVHRNSKQAWAKPPPTTSKVFFENEAPAPQVFSPLPQPPPQAQASFPQQMAFPQQAAFPPPTSTARPASTSFTSSSSPRKKMKK
jgi:hypothetical protein